MLRSDFSDVERDWQRRRLFGPPRPRPRPGLWLFAGSLLASGMYLAAQTVLPLGPSKPLQSATALTDPQPQPQPPTAALQASPPAGVQRDPDPSPLPPQSP